MEKPFTLELFKDLYITKNFTVMQLCDKFKLSKWHIQEYIKNNNISKKKRRRREDMMHKGINKDSEYDIICEKNKSSEILIDRHNNLRLVKNKEGVYLLYEMIDDKWVNPVIVKNPKGYNTLEELKKNK